MATVSNINGQFKFVNTNKSEFYQYPKLSHLTYVLNNEGEYYIQFTYEDDYFVRIKLSELTNQPTWTNTQPGAEQAVNDISSWIYATASGLATEATLLNIDSNIADILGNTDAILRTASMFRTTASGNLSSVATKIYSVSVSNVGTANGIVQGSTLKPNETVNFDASSLNHYFNSFAYNATGTEFIIIYVA